MRTRFKPRRANASASTSIEPTLASSLLPSAWVRPAHWPAMSEPAVNSVKLLYRMAVNNVQPITIRTGNRAAYVSIGGDTVTYQTLTNDTALSIFPNYAANTTAVASDGYKYCVVTITPVGLPFTVLYLDDQPTGYPNPSYAPPNSYVETIINTPLLSTLRIHGYTGSGRVNPYLEHVRIMAVDPYMAYQELFYRMTALRKVTTDIGYLDIRGTMSYLFAYCTALSEFPKIVITSASKITASNAFLGCTAMTVLPDINYERIGIGQYLFKDCQNLLEADNRVFLGVTNAAGFFYGCYALQWKDTTVTLPYTTSISSLFYENFNLTKLPDLNFPLATGIGNAVAFCPNLTEVGNIHAPLATSAYALFDNNKSLLKVGNVYIPATQTVSQMFNYNYSLRQVGTITTGTALTSMDSMYYMCQAIENPAMPSNTQNVSTANSLFAYCRNMLKAPVLNLSNVNASNLFQECWQLVDASQVNITLTVTATSMYANCTALQKPATVVSYVYSNTATNLATGCRALQIIPDFHISRSFSLANSGFTAANLNVMFTSMGNAYNFGAETVTVTGCPGAATCDASILSAKGWNLTR